MFFLFVCFVFYDLTILWFIELVGAWALTAGLECLLYYHNRTFGRAFTQPSQHKLERSYFVFFTFFFSDFTNINKLLDELPDELSFDGPSSLTGLQQNGARDPLGLDTSQKHQQLSQLLSSSSVPNSQQGASSQAQALMAMNSLQHGLNKVNSMASPPQSQAMLGLAGKANDLLGTPPYSSMAPTSSAGFSVGLPGNMNKPLTSPALTSQSLLNSTSNSPLHQPNLLNGPHLAGLGGPGAGPRGPGPGAGPTASTMGGMPPVSLQPSMAQGTMNNMANSMAAGQLSANQIDMNHPTLNTTAPTQPLMQVSFMGEYQFNKTKNEWIN